MSLVLYQFAASHFNEKARWALGLKRVPHQRISLLPGPHAPKMKRLSGKTQTPVLVDDGEVVAGSAPIIDHLEARFPEPSLYPADADQRRRALEIQREFDAAVGPAVRLAKFFDVLDAGYVSGTFGRDAHPVARGLYRAAFPPFGSS